MMPGQQQLHRLRVSVINVFLLAGLVTACDPCTGMAGCSGDPAAGISGRILDEITGAPAAGVPIDFIRVGGAPVRRDSVRVTTDSEGLFAATLDALASEDVIVDVVVSPPGLPGYRVRNLRVPVSRRSGEAMVLPAWANRPTLPELAYAYRRAFPKSTYTNVNVTFRRTGGTPVDGLVNETFTTSGGADGWFALFARQVRPLTLDTLYGELTVAEAAPFQTRSVKIVPSHEFRRHARLLDFGFGPSIEWHFIAIDRGHGGRVVSGVTVEFQKTGGIPVTVPNWTATTDGTGQVIFPGMTEASGELFGRLSVTPPAPWKAFQRDIALSTFEADSGRMFDTLWVGPGLPYKVRVRNGAQALANVEVEFIRTGGISVVPDRFTVKTNSAGEAFIEPDPAVEGTVTADIVVRPPAPFATFTVRGVQMQAIDGDRPSRHVLLGDWDVNAPPVTPGTMRSRP